MTTLLKDMERPRAGSFPAKTIAVEAGRGGGSEVVIFRRVAGLVLLDRLLRRVAAMEEVAEEENGRRGKR